VWFIIFRFGNNESFEEISSFIEIFYCGNSFLKNKIIIWHPSDEPENVQWY
jgi:hypothetical protein